MQYPKSPIIFLRNFDCFPRLLVTRWNFLYHNLSVPVNPLGEMSLKMSTEHSCIMINIGEPPFFLVSHSQKKCRAKYLFINQVRDHKPLFEHRLSQNQHTKHVSVFFFLARTDSGQVWELHIGFPNVRWSTSDWIAVSFFSVVQ